jgi:hypothetical protein
VRTVLTVSSHQPWHGRTVVAGDVGGRGHDSVDENTEDRVDDRWPRAAAAGQVVNSRPPSPRCERYQTEVDSRIRWDPQEQTSSPLAASPQRRHHIADKGRPVRNDDGAGASS